MPQTIDQTTWQATVVLDDGVEPYARTAAFHEFPGARSKGLAVAWINRTLLSLGPAPAASDADQSAHWYGVVERGTYHDTSFDNPGPVNDATWEPDERDGVPVRAYAHIAADGTITWDEC